MMAWSKASSLPAYRNPIWWVILKASLRHTCLFRGIPETITSPLKPRHLFVKHAAIGPISVHFPEQVETNDDLRAEHPAWNMDLIYEKTGIAVRHIAAEDEFASDLGVQAAESLFADHGVDPTSIDFLLFCTQTPDYPLPTTACLMQQRLGLPTSCGALDFNLGCSGFVYGLALADGLIQSGAASRILLITAETYSKYIDKGDRSLRTIFGDGAAATLIESHDQPSLSSFKFGTDGSGADMLMLTEGGMRCGPDALQPRHRHRWKSSLYMDGPSLINFTMDEIPLLIDNVLTQSGVDSDQVDLYLMHQATFKMLDQLRRRLKLAEERVPIRMETYGNTVSSTLPVLIWQLRNEKVLDPARMNLLVGFGVGLSLAACSWQDLLQPEQESA